MTYYKYVTLFEIVKTTDPKLKEFIGELFCGPGKVFRHTSNIFTHLNSNLDEWDELLKKWTAGRISYDEFLERKAALNIDEKYVVTEFDHIKHIKVHTSCRIFPDSLTTGQARRYIPRLLRQIFPEANCKTHNLIIMKFRMGLPWGFQAYTLVKRKQQIEILVT